MGLCLLARGAVGSDGRQKAMILLKGQTEPTASWKASVLRNSSGAH